LEFGDTLLYLDENGHSDKSLTQYENHRDMQRLRVLCASSLIGSDVVITEKPVTVVNKEHYNEIEEILERTFLMWQEVGYWSDQILFRTGSFSTRQGLLSANFENKNIAYVIKQIRELLKKGGYPDQFLLHPVPPKKIFREGFFATRCFFVDGVCSFELGFGNIEQTWQLEQADVLISGTTSGVTDIKVLKGEMADKMKAIVERIALGLFHFCLNAPGVIVPIRPQGERPYIYEFKTFHTPENNKIVIEFIDYEIYR
jgi:hypothetical protein